MNQKIESSGAKNSNAELKEGNGRFHFYEGNIWNTKPTAEWTIEQAYNYITLDMGAMQNTLWLRGLSSTKERNDYKAKNLAYCTFSGTFSKRKNDCLIEHSGLMCLDFDHLGDRLQEAKRLLIGDKVLNVVLLFRSPSGDGLKAIAPVNLKQGSHEKWYCAFSAYLNDKYNLIADPACKDVSRACFLPHDSDCFIDRNKINTEIICPF